MIIYKMHVFGTSRNKDMEHNIIDNIGNNNIITYYS